MHDGSLPTLGDVLDLYSMGGRNLVEGPHAGDGRASPLKDTLVRGFDLSREERKELIAFLEALTDDAFIERAKRRAE
jgi:cytochrome c peroxidase